MDFKHKKTTLTSLIRSQVLYPAELRAHTIFNKSRRN